MSAASKILKRIARNIKKQNSIARRMARVKKTEMRLPDSVGVYYDTGRYNGD